MRTCLFLSIVCLLCLATESRADKKGPPYSRTVATKDGKYIFVMLAPGSYEQEISRGGTEESHKAVKAIRDKYKKSGLYKNDGSAEPLWTIDWYRPGFILLNDGVHLIRYGDTVLESWAKKEKRENRVVSDNDLKQESISIFAKGKLLKEYKIGDFVDDRKALPMSVTSFKWAKKYKVDEDRLQVEYLTHDGNRILIDLKTGNIIEKKKAE